MRVLLADGDPDVRGALRLLLTHDLGMQVIGEATEATDLRMQVRGLGPDLLLLDWALVDAGARDTVADLRALFPRLRIAVLSAHPETRVHALAAGADAFVCKADAPVQLVTTLRALHATNASGPAGDGAGAGNVTGEGDT